MTQITQISVVATLDRMKRLQSRWLRRALKASVVVLCVLGLVAVGWLVLNWHIGKELNAKGTSEARQGVVEVAEKMRASPKPLPRDLTPEELFGTRYEFRLGKFDYHGYSITVRGSDPRYEGTTVIYHGQAPQPVITLTVSDLLTRDWTVSEELPHTPWYSLR